MAKGKQMAAAVHWALLEAAQLATDAQLDAESQVRKLEGELKWEKDVQSLAALFASEPADKVGEQDNTLETCVCHFAKLQAHKLPQIKLWVLETKPD